MAAPFVKHDRETSQYDEKHNPHRYGAKPGANIPIRTYVIGLALSAVIILVGFAILWSVPGYAREGTIHPIKAPDALLRARAACPSDSVTCLHGKLREAYAGLEWAKKERAHTYAPTVAYAIRLACASQPTVDCAWLNRMIHCESKGDPRSKNRTSTASGLAQFLDGTWSGNAYGRFDVFDPIANALGAAWLAARNGHGPWYASRGCWS